MIDTKQDLILNLLEDSKVQNITVHHGNNLCQYIIVGTCTSSKHAIATTDKLVEKLSVFYKNGIITQGIREGQWILIDAYDIMIHLFLQESRDKYQLEELFPICSIA
jgi:ribosome-associated protein